MLPVNFTGTPAPKATWYLNDKPIESVKPYNIDSGDKHSTLQAKGVTAAEAGKYKVVAENEAGSDSAEFTVNIKGIFINSCLQIH